MSTAKKIQLGFRMHCTSHNIRQAIEQHDMSQERADNLKEIADMLDEAESLLDWYAEKCDILSHLVLTYKREGDISRKHIEKLIA